MTAIKTEITEKTKCLVIELAKSLNIDFPRDKTCSDCFYYDYEDNLESINLYQHRCWNENKVTIRPCDSDDMSHMDYIAPHKIENLNEAIDCPYYKAGLDDS